MLNEPKLAEPIPPPPLPPRLAAKESALAEVMRLAPTPPPATDSFTSALLNEDELPLVFMSVVELVPPAPIVTVVFALR
jgi:hypothetical protein